MACLFLLRDDRPDDSAAMLARARASLAKQGFRDLTERSIPGWRLLHAGPIMGGTIAAVERDGDFLHVAGTLVFDGRVGEAALLAALDAGPAADPARIGGQFVALMRRRGRNFLFTDQLGAFQLFHDRDRRIFSTSLLATAECLPRVTLNAQALYEWAFNVVAIGNDTILSEIALLGPDEAIELTAGGTVSHPITRPLAGPMDRATPIEERLTGSRDRLMAAVEGHVAAFGDAIQCPLSGGFDSRLVLAALRAAGARPHVYVYGHPDLPDVRIAREIGRSEGFEVACIDKGLIGDTVRTPDRDRYAETMAATFHWNDGLPNFGNIFDDGRNAAAWRARHAGGALAVSGGAGEIYRDFFRLPDRPAPASAIVQAFFSRFTASDTTALFDAGAFRTRLRDKILDALGTPGETGLLPRSAIEHAYPRVRCRSLFGRELSIEARLSPYLMPFLDPAVIADAMTLPMAWKHAGLFQSRLIAAIYPALARYPSTYGHDFAGVPSAAHRRSEWQSRHRPLWLRERSYAIQRRLKPVMDDEHGALDRVALAGAMDTDLPLMRHYFAVDRITDNGLWRRIACLEYFAQAMGSKLAMPALPVRAARVEQTAERFAAPAHMT